MKSKIYITDEGFGPIVRQRAIIEELIKLLPNLKVELQLDRHYKDAKRIIPGYKYTKKFNNIVWQKNEDGGPNISGISNYYKNYNQIAKEYIQTESVNFSSDFIISDFVYEAFEIAKKNNIPSFGTAHFTWDWFFSKLYPPVMDKKVISKMMERALLADVLFFPPFTPKEILNFYKSKVIEVPLIVRKQKEDTVKEINKKPKIMFIDSGSGVNRLAMQQIITKLTLIDSFSFYISDSFDIQAENITLIPTGEMLVDYIGLMDLVVGRAGFNTISECIAFKTPMLLFGENLNPEMRENAIFVKEEGLGSFTNLKQLIDSPQKVLEDFFEGEYTLINRNMQQNTYRTDGAKVIAEIIAEKVNRK